MRAEKEKKKRELFSTILWSAVLICMIVQIALPETGVLGMVKEGSYAVLFLGIGGSCVWAIIQKWKKDKAAVVLGIFMLILTVGIGGWISRKLVLDLIEGPKIVHLTSITMKESSGMSGIISHHYYLCGRDDNDKWKGYQMEVSADEYYELEGKQQVTVLCYPRTERILKFL